MTEHLVEKLRGMMLPRGYNQSALIDAADTIEQQSKLLDQALEALESVPAWDRLGYANMKVERSITAIKQFKEQK